jgi:benzodiazapine receptor
MSSPTRPTGVARPGGGVDDVYMSVLSQRSARVDIVRSAVVAVLAIVQILVAVMVGGSVGVVANMLRTPLLAANWAFAIWAPIYIGYLAYAGYQLLPAQRSREVHRRTGWWMAASGVLNPAWILAFSGRVILLAQLFLIVLLVVLAIVFGRLSREPAADRVERAAFRGPVALYAGWVSMATVLGTAATGVWAGLPGANALAAIAAVVVLLAVAGIVSWVVLSGTAVVPYAAAVVWALLGIALNAPPAAVVITGAVVIVIVLAATVRRVTTAGSRVRAAWG